MTEQFQLKIYPMAIIRAYREALDDMIQLLQEDVSVSFSNLRFYWLG